MIPYSQLVEGLMVRPAKIGLDTQAVLFMCAAAADPGASFSKLADTMGVPPPVITRCKARIPRRYLQISKVDGRTYSVCLTAAGQRALESFFEDGEI
jgi:hypothetical protein